MKDIPHHMKKFFQKFAHSDPAIEQQEEKKLTQELKIPDSKLEQRKKVKRSIKKQRLAHIPTHKSKEQRNKEEKKRGPVRDNKLRTYYK
jgi:hypothetical protein